MTCETKGDIAHMKIPSEIEYFLSWFAVPHIMICVDFKNVPRTGFTARSNAKNS